MHVPKVDFTTETGKASVLTCIVAVLACLLPFNYYKVFHTAQGSGVPQCTQDAQVAKLCPGTHFSTPGDRFFFFKDACEEHRKTLSRIVCKESRLYVRANYITKTSLKTTIGMD